MTDFAREEAVDRLETIVETVESERMPVPVRELWVYGDLALGLDPVERLDVYLTKDLLLHDDTDDDADRADRDEDASDAYAVEGIGETVRSGWAAEFPDYVRANPNGYVAPEKCLGAHLLNDDEPIHLEVCNAGFEDNVTQRLKGALARENYEQLLDPRGVCLWIDGQRSTDAFEKLRAGEFVFPTLAEAFEMIGMDEERAEDAATVVESYRECEEGATVRGEVV